MRFVGGLLLLLMLAGCAAPYPARWVQFPLLKNDAQLKNSWAGKQVTLKGEFSVPAGSTSPVPVVIIINGVNGLEPRYGLPMARNWASWFHGLGVATLIMDSYTPRGLPQDIKGTMPDYGGDPQNWFSEAQRAEDVISAYRWLDKQPQVDPGRVYAIGFSHGGGTVLHLWAKPESHLFAGLIDLYGACHALPIMSAVSAVIVSRQAHQQPKFTPLLVIAGDKDRAWQVVQCSRTLISAGQPITGKVFHGVFHGFDYPGPDHDEAAFGDSRKLIEEFIRQSRGSE